MNSHALSLVVVTGAIALGGPATRAQAAAEPPPRQERLVWLSPSEALRVFEAGAGDPVVLVPGLFGSAFGYRRVVPLLAAAGCRVVVVEPLGVGGSSRPDVADYSLTAQADRLDRVLGSLEVERAVVVAHSTSASVALRLAYRHPRRAAAVVSLDGGPAEAATTPGFRRALRLTPIFRRLATPTRIRAQVRSTLVTRSANAAWVTEDVVDGYMDAGSADLGTTLGFLRGMARAREPEPIGAHLHEIACPIRLVMGGVPHEGGPGPEQVQALCQGVASLVIEIVPGVGHFLFEEDPPAFVATVERAREASRAAVTVAQR